MKIKYLVAGLMLTSAAMVGCEQPDDLMSGGDNLSNMVVKGVLVSDLSKEYNSVVDEADHTITVQVSYYISDTEKIQGDLTQMKLIATLPYGAKFEPSLQGIHNLEEGIDRVLHYNDGRQIPYRIKADKVMSSKALIEKIVIPKAPGAPVNIVNPTADQLGKITIFKTSSNLEDALNNVELKVSSWATIKGDEVNADGTFNLNKIKELTVTSQNGKTVNKYEVEFQYPELLPEGQHSQPKAMFGLGQGINGMPQALGFVNSNNRSLAVVDGHLIISDTHLNFIVINRFTGEQENVKVNTDGLIMGCIHSIKNDDANHLVAISFAAANNKWVSNRLFEIYVWKNGIEAAPEKIFSADILGADMADFRKASAAFSESKTWDIGRTMGVCGDVTGDAMLTSLGLTSGGGNILRVKIKGGVVASVTGATKGLWSWQNQSKVVPMSATEDYPICYNVCHPDAARNIVYREADREVHLARVGNWWNGGQASMDVKEFNGMWIGAVSNFSGRNYRLCVGDITSFTVDAFQKGQIFDSRLDNYDHNNGRDIGKGAQNFGPTGFLSNYKTGPNTNNTADVLIVKSIDGNAIQIYMLITDCGIMAYELTRYNI